MSENINHIFPILDWDQWRALVNMEPAGSSKEGGCTDELNDYKLM
jgi:hypothetical protein